MMGWGMHGFRGHGMFGGGGIMMILFWALIIGGIIYLFRRGSHHGHYGGHHRHNKHHGRHWDHENRSGSNRSLEILKERYAKGEIDKETYKEMKADLED